MRPKSPNFPSASLPLKNFKIYTSSLCFIPSHFFTVVKTIILPHRPPVLPPAPHPCHLCSCSLQSSRGWRGCTAGPVLCSVYSRTGLCLSLMIFAFPTLVFITVNNVFYSKVLLVSRYIGYLTLKYTRKKDKPFPNTYSTFFTIMQMMGVLILYYFCSFFVSKSGLKIP